MRQYATATMGMDRQSTAGRTLSGTAIITRMAMHKGASRHRQPGTADVSFLLVFILLLTFLVCGSQWLST